MTMWQRYSTFLRQPPELTVEWRDPVTGARGWLIINSLRGGAAGGGTRMRPGVNPREVTYLAKAMELKFALAGPAIGGAKAGIDFDPFDPRKPEILQRWYTAIRPYLQDSYGTAGDLGVDEVLDVIPAISRLGIGHPQEGIVRGHLRPEGEGLRRIIANLQGGVEAPVHAALALTDYLQIASITDIANAPSASAANSSAAHAVAADANTTGMSAPAAGAPVTVADMVTGYGVAYTIRHYYERRGRSLDGVRVLLEGFGNVGAACGLYLARWGARIVAIADLRSVLIAPDGLDATEVEELIRRREDKLLPADDPRLIPPAERARFLETPAEIFICAAASGSVGAETLDRLAASGVEIIASGANHPFREGRLGSTRVARLADRRFAILPDILANCGMARTFSYLMEEGAVPRSESIFAAVDRTIGDTLDEVLERAGIHSLSIGGEATAQGGSGSGSAGDARTRPVRGSSSRADRRVSGLLAATLGLGLDRVGAP
jgi:glutamate dehydrogenase (NAD(P)+)